MINSPHCLDLLFICGRRSFFIIAEKARARGADVKRCRCGERQRVKAGGWRGLAHTRWSGGRGYLLPKEREVERRLEVCEWDG